MNRFSFFKKKSFIILIFSSIGNLQASTAIIPGDWWNDPSILEQAEYPIQKQLDTGVGMNDTAWDMSNVKDARLFITYIRLFQSLNKADQDALFKEQSDWLKTRSKKVKKLHDPNGGTAVYLDMACKRMDMTDVRIKELQQRLEKIKPRQNQTKAK